MNRTFTTLLDCIWLEDYQHDSFALTPLAQAFWNAAGLDQPINNLSGSKVLTLNKWEKAGGLSFEILKSHVSLSTSS